MVRALLIISIAVAAIALWAALNDMSMVVDNYPESERNSGPLFVYASIPYWDQQRAFEQLRLHAEDIDAVSLFWYRLDSDGSIRTYSAAREDDDILSFARERGIKTVGLIANLPEAGNWDADAVDRVIAAPDARARHIGDIVALAERKGFDGINIDYEFLRDSQTEDFTAFINELGAALEERGKFLVVAIHPQLPGTETRGQDIPSLTGAHYLYYMTYDQHWETSSPGAVAEIGWVREVLSYAEDQRVPMNKILLGIPLDGYDWPRHGDHWDRASGVQYEDAVARSEDTGVAIEYNADVEAPHYSYTSPDGASHVVWFEDVRSFRPKYDVAKEFGVAGIALWRLGREDERIYGVIDD